MKCLIDPETKKVRRVTEEQVAQLLLNGWKFTSKEEWKLNGRKYLTKGGKV
jgi:hypothetical protein